MKFLLRNSIPLEAKLPLGIKASTYPDPELTSAICSLHLYRDSEDTKTG